MNVYQARVLQEQLVLIRYAEFQATRVLGLRWHTRTLYVTEADSPAISNSQGRKKIVQNSQKSNDLKVKTVGFCPRDRVVSI